MARKSKGPPLGRRPAPKERPGDEAPLDLDEIGGVNEAHPGRDRDIGG
ncbi:MAG: hypothetical protein HY553_22625 [Elusimicrobia bacterium]|nr:hypothetical protein [Elusimicrobiota bacterium]